MVHDVVTATRDQWSALVRFAVFCSPQHVEEQSILLAKETRSNPATLKLKIKAIQYVKEAGWDLDGIIDSGQSAVLTAYRAGKKKGLNEKERFLTWRVPAGLADEIDKEVVRIARACEIKTSIELWELLHATILSMSDAWWRHEAGMSRLKKRKRLDQKA